MLVSDCTILAFFASSPALPTCSNAEAKEVVPTYRLMFDKFLRIGRDPETILNQLREIWKDQPFDIRTNDQDLVRQARSIHIPYSGTSNGRQSYGRESVPLLMVDYIVKEVKQID
jgi:hypothetical protein